MIGDQETPATEQHVHVRPASFTDATAIANVHFRNGLGALDESAWRARWESYPFALEFDDIPIGWVLQTAAAEVVGTIGNVHMLYEFNGRRLQGAIATDWGVDAAYRGKALNLTTAFFKQKGIDVLLNGSASPTASRVLEGLNIPRIPIPDFGVPCLWAASPRTVSRAALERRGTPLAPLLSWPAGWALLVRDTVNRSGRGKLSSQVNTSIGFDDRFDELWKRISAGPKRLRAVRTRAVLEWRFGSDLAAGRATLLTSQTGGELSGYAVLLSRLATNVGMALYDVADLQAAEDDQSVYRDLILGAVRLARENGVAAVKLLTGTPATRAPALALRPHNYQLPHWPLFFRAAKELRTELSQADAWDFSLFDTY
jgi:hypothetical protein